MSGGGKPGLHQRSSGNQQQGKGKQQQQQQQQQQQMLPPKMPKKRQSGKRSTSLPVLIGCGLCALVVVLGFQWYMTALPEPAATLTRPPKKAAKAKRDIFGVPETKRELKANPKKRESLEWSTLPRDYDGCLEQQQELMTIPVPWPGFHAICIDSVSTAALGVALHNRSGDPTRSVEAGTRLLHVAAEAELDLADSLVGRLKDELLHLEFQRVDPMVSTSEYDFPPNPWRLFTAVGNPVESGADLQDLGRGAMLYLYTGGQFIWPGVRIGHVTRVPIPVTDGSPGGHKVVEMTTASLRPLVLVLSDFLTLALALALALALTAHPLRSPSPLNLSAHPHPHPLRSPGASCTRGCICTSRMRTATPTTSSLTLRGTSTSVGPSPRSTSTTAAPASRGRASSSSSRWPAARRRTSRASASR